MSIVITHGANPLEGVGDAAIEVAKLNEERRRARAEEAIRAGQQRREDEAATREQKRFNQEQQDRQDMNTAETDALSPRGMTPPPAGRRLGVPQPGADMAPASGAAPPAAPPPASTSPYPTRQNLGPMTGQPPAAQTTAQPDASVPDTLPKELWPEYYRLQQKLQTIQNPKARALLVDKFHKDAYAFAHIKGIDSLISDMSHDLDSGVHQGDPEKDPTGHEAEAIQSLRNNISALGDYRSQVAENPEKFDPAHIEQVRAAYNLAKQKLAEVDATKNIRANVVAGINTYVAKWADNPRMQNQFIQLSALAGREGNNDKLDELRREAQKLDKAPEMFGDGAPFDQAAPEVRREVYKEALQHAATSVPVMDENGDRYSASERQRLIMTAVDAFIPSVAKSYGWGPTEAERQADQSSAAAQDPFQRAQGAGAATAPSGAAPAAPGGQPQMPRTPEEAAAVQDPAVRVRAVQSAQQQIVRAKAAIDQMPDGPDKKAALERLRAEAAKWIKVQGNDPNAPLKKAGPKRMGSASVPEQTYQGGPPGG